MGVDVTALLASWRHGDRAALEQVTPLIHQELRRLAHRYMAGQRSGGTLQSTLLLLASEVR